MRPVKVRQIHTFAYLDTPLQNNHFETSQLSAYI